MARASQAKPLAASDFWKASQGFSLVWVAHLGRRHGLLRALAGSARALAPGELAQRANRNPGAVRLWCEAAEALGLLQREGARYALPQALHPLLVHEHGAAYLGGHLDYLALRSMDADAFDAFFRDGKPSARRPRYLIQAFEEATKWDHTAFLEVLVPRVPALKRALTRGADVLDVGAGAGAWSFRVAEAFPRSRLVGVEPDLTAIRLARAEGAKRGVDERVRFEAVRAERMQFSKRFDVAFLGEVLCNTEEGAAILERCHAALREGGRLVVAEGLVDSGAATRDPGNALVIAMRLEFALQPAQLFDKRELKKMLAAAGFSKLKWVPTGGGFWFVVAEKARANAKAPR